MMEPLQGVEGQMGHCRAAQGVSNTPHYRQLGAGVARRFRGDVPTWRGHPLILQLSHAQAGHLHVLLRSRKLENLLLLHLLFPISVPLSFPFSSPLPFPLGLPLPPSACHQA